jgi:hypothetical protein
MALPKGEGGSSRDELAESVSSSITDNIQEVVSEDKKQTSALNNLVSLMSKMINMQEALLDESARSRFREVENVRESARKKPAGPKTIFGEEKDLSISGLLGFLTTIPGIISAITAIGASLTGLDTALRAIKIADVAKNLALALRAFSVGFADETAKVLKNLIDIPKNLSKVFVIPDETKALFKNVPTIIGTVVDNLFKPFDVFIENFKIGFNRIGTKATGIVDSVLKVGDFDTLAAKAGAIVGKINAPFVALGNGIDSISEGIGSITKFLPSIDFSALKAVFGSVDSGTGIIGFLGKALSIFKPLLIPFEFAAKTILRPFTQILLSIIDFATGFIDGFKGAEGESLGDRILSGINEGIRSVIRGFTEAIDLLLFTFPGWIAEKLGFEKIAAKLKDFNITKFVDPVIDGVIDFVKNIFTSEGRQALAGEADGFFKKVLRYILPDPGIKFSPLNPKSWVSAAVPDAVYEYAGLNPKTGERIIPDTNTSGIATPPEITDQSLTLAAKQAEADAAKAAANKPANGGGTIVTTVDGKSYSKTDMNVVGKASTGGGREPAPVDLNSWASATP